MRAKTAAKLARGGRVGRIGFMIFLTALLQEKTQHYDILRLVDYPPAYQ
jgi:hypothetical protein